MKTSDYTTPQLINRINRAKLLLTGDWMQRIIGSRMLDDIRYALLPQEVVDKLVSYMPSAYLPIAVFNSTKG